MSALRIILQLAIATSSLLTVLVATNKQSAAVTQLHDTEYGVQRVINGATNGQGNHRGPWVVQISLAKDEYLDVRVGLPNVAADLQVRMITGNGSVYFNDTVSRPIYCIKVPVTGWVTIAVDVPGTSEQTFYFKYKRSLIPCTAPYPPH